MKHVKILLCLLIAAAFGGCNSSERIEGDGPRIVFDNNSYTLKIGKSLVLDPRIENGGGAEYLWTVDGGKVGTQASYTFYGDDEGSFYVKLNVRTKYGEAGQEVRIDVLAVAPPAISFAMAGGRFDAVAGTDYVIEPIVRNGDDARYEWTLDGQPAGTDASYKFNEQPGSYSLKLKVTNDDGSDEKTITVNVADELPLRVTFEKPYYAAASNDIPVFTDRPLYLSPTVEGGGELSYAWMVDGEPAGNGKILKFTSPDNNEHTIAVTVTSGSAVRSERISRTVTREGGSVTATVKVKGCGSESARFRPATGVSSAFAGSVVEYMPAPGQFINDGLSGFDGQTTLKGANEYARKRLAGNNYVSLGGFGGYIIVGFDHSIENKGGYEGYDFAIAGNQHDGSSEPGVVWVMQDVNGNGLPDDVWYELRGSETGAEGTIQEYAVTYVRPSGARSGTPWFDNRGNTGSISYLSSYHAQDYYYPAWVAEGAYTLRGTCLKARNRKEGSQWVNAAYEWGYADNMGEDRLTGGSNSGAGAQNVYFKISNAMNPDGSPANLQYVDFIKVQTAVNAQSGPTGEISTEVFSFKDMNL